MTFEAKQGLNGTKKYIALKALFPVNKGLNWNIKYGSLKHYFLSTKV
jgi:hypothetical protein